MILLTMLTACSLLGDRSEPPGAVRPNVVVLIGCTLRRDQLETYGGPVGLTPHSAALARSGAHFADALAAAPWTKPGHTALLTGHHAVSIGMVEPSRRRNNKVLPDRVTTAAELFEQAGYTTLGLTANPNTSAIFGFDQGFDRYDQPASLWRIVGTVKPPGAEVVDRALEMVDESTDDTPFYLQLTLVDAHQPLDTDEETGRTLASDGVTTLMGQYRGDLQRFDGALGRLLVGLEAQGHGVENTLVVLISDHGEGVKWPRHHEMQHGYSLYGSVLEMPWIVAGPGIPAGHVVEGLASQVDLLPTLAGLVGLDGYEGPGQDWSAQLRGEVDRTTRTRAWADTWFWAVQRSAIHTDDRLCTQEWRKPKRTRSSVSLPECFDRKQDPLSKYPLLLDEPLLTELDGWYRERLAEGGRFGEVEVVVLDEELKQQLDQLGYVELDGD